MFTRARTFLILIILLFIASYLPGQIAWDWVKHSSRSGPDEANDLIVDDHNNIYVTGYYTNIELPWFSLKDKDAFIAKYDSLGELVWYQKYASTGHDIGNAIALDDSNFVYVTGSYDDSKKMFLIKLENSDGKLLWEIFDSSLALNTGDDLLIKDAIIYTTGSIPLLRYDLKGQPLQSQIKSNKKSELTLDIPTAAIVADDSCLLYVACNNTILVFDTAGQQISSLYLNVTRINSLAIDKLNNIFCTGVFTGSCMLGKYQITSSGYDDIFICKIDAAGNISWAMKAGGSSHDEGLGIAINKRQELFVTGFYRQIATFGDQTVGELGLFKEIFVLKLDPETGNFTELLVAGGGGDYDLSNSITFDNDNFPYIAGLLHHWWPGTSFGDIYLPYEGESLEDAFIAKITVPEMISKLKGKVYKDSIETYCVVKLFSYSQENPMKVLYNNYTDESGNFGYTVYKPGNYFVQAIQPFNYDYAKTYYEQHYKWDSAFHFTLDFDTVVNDINIHLLKVPKQAGTDTISGTVYDLSGEPKRWIDMILVDNLGTITDYTQTDSMGKYEFISIPPGNYVIMIDSAGMFVESYYSLNTSLKSNYIGFDYILGVDSIYRADNLKVSANLDTFILDEICFNGTVLGYVDVPNRSRFQNLNFTILEQDISNTFGIVPDSGKIFVADSTLLNYEDHPVHKLIIKVENTSPLYSSDTIEVIVQLKKVFHPIISSSTFSIDENVPAATVVGKVLLDETNGDENLTFEIVSESFVGIFDIISPDGDIIIIDSSLLDYEIVQQIILIVKVTESSVWQFSDTCTVTILINDIPENIGQEKHVTHVENLRIFPSPVSDRLYIIQEDAKNPVKQVVITDLSGRIMINNKIPELTHLVIDIQKLENGAYIIDLVFSYGQTKQVFIKSR